MTSLHSDVTKSISISSSKQAFLRIEADGVPQGRLEFRLFADKLPVTVENFLSLCCGRHAGYSYKSSPVHRVIPGYAMNAGDFQCGDGSGGWSIYGKRFFADEGFHVRHDRAGVLSMVNTGPDTNGSQFLVTLAPCPWLDNRHVAFGQLESGWDVLERIEALGSHSGRPAKRIIIVDCGEVMDDGIMG